VSEARQWRRGMHQLGDNRKPDARETSPAALDVIELSEGVRPLLEQSVGVSWYEAANDVDAAAAALCRLRRAAAGARGGPEGGDAAVRDVLAEATPAAVLWVASRAISYMDEHGFPESSGASFED
jgi:hypothetical protein